MAKTKSITKELTETKVSDNGQIEEEQEKSPKQLELESIVAQYNNCIQRRDQHTSAAKNEDKMAERCLGGIEILERQIKDESSDIDNNSI